MRGGGVAPSGRGHRAVPLYLRNLSSSDGGRRPQSMRDRVAGLSSTRRGADGADSHGESEPGANLFADALQSLLDAAGSEGGSRTGDGVLNEQAGNGRVCWVSSGFRRQTHHRLHPALTGRALWRCADACHRAHRLLDLPAGASAMPIEVETKSRLVAGWDMTQRRRSSS